MPYTAAVQNAPHPIIAAHLNAAEGIRSIHRGQGPVSFMCIQP